MGPWEGSPSVTDAGQLRTKPGHGVFMHLRRPVSIRAEPYASDNLAGTVQTIGQHEYSQRILAVIGRPNRVRHIGFAKGGDVDSSNGIPGSRTQQAWWRQALSYPTLPEGDPKQALRRQLACLRSYSNSVWHVNSLRTL